MAIGTVVTAFRQTLPDADIYVYDNNSSDGTTGAAREAGAVVRRETMQGKGHVVRRMFADVEADAYVLVDGDGTYDPATAPLMLARLWDEQLDMVTGARVSGEQAAYRPGHRAGNVVLSRTVAYVFGDRVTDLLSGYRVFSRRFVKSFPAAARGFETEAEFTVHALDLRLPMSEVPTPYRARPAGSASKLSTYRDGLHILGMVLFLIRDDRPLKFFATIAGLALVAGLATGVPVVQEFSRTGLVPRLPSAVLATGLVLLAFLAAGVGLILDSVARGRTEVKRLAYLAVPAPTGINRGSLP